MEPLSITAACVGILGTIGPLVLKIRTFAVGVREARGKMGSLDQELSSPSMLIEILNDESNDPTFDYPLALRQSFVEVLGHCKRIVGEMTAVVERFGAGRLGRRRHWETSG